MPKYNSINVLDFLSENEVMFCIPVFQRNYEWGNNECTKFFLDIVQTAKKAELKQDYTQHFFGVVYYTFDEQAYSFGDIKQYMLIDGQQRLTTVLLFLAAARDTISNSKLKQYINNKYLNISSCNQSYSTKIKLKQAPCDNTVYAKIIHSQQLTKQEQSSLIYKNYLYFCKQLKLRQDIDSLLSNGLQNFYIGTAQLVDGENPQEIFESLNSTGKGLDLSALILNHLLLPIPPEKQESLYAQCWMPIENRLHSEINKFFRDTMQMDIAHLLPPDTPSNYKKLFAQFETQYNGKDVSKLLLTFEYDSAIYEQMLHCNTVSPKINQALAKLFDLKRITSLRSFVLKLLICWDTKQLTELNVVDILDVLHNYCVRRLLIGNLSGNISKMFASLSQYLEPNGILLTCTDKKQQMFEILSSLSYNCRFPNDNEIENAMLTELDWYHDSRADICYHILLLAECYLTNRSFFRDANIQIEHIMPQTLSSDWKQELGENWVQIHQKFIHSLGNLTLVTRNQELGNKSFSAKKEVYLNSTGLQIAQAHIVNCSNWNQESIQNRAKWLCHLIITQLIPLPITMQFVSNYMCQHDGISSVLPLSMNDLIGETINFSSQPNQSAIIASGSEVRYQNQVVSLAILTQRLLSLEGRNLNHMSCEHFWDYKGNSLYSLTH